MVQTPTFLHSIRHLHMPPCDFGSPPAPPPLLEPPDAATAPLSWGRGIVLDLPATRASILTSRCLRDYYIMALSVCPRSSTRALRGASAGNCFQSSRKPTVVHAEST